MSAEVVSAASVSEANKKTSLIRELFKLMIPSLITAVFGFLIWNAQTQIQQTVNSSNQILLMQMVLKEEFYKRRLTIYEEACRNITGVRSALDEAGAAPEKETQAMIKLAELDKLNKSNALYWSDDLEKRLAALWSLGIDKLRYKQFADEATNKSISSEISGLYKQMKDDLAVKEMARITHQKD